MKFNLEEFENDILQVTLIGRMDLKGVLEIDDRFTFNVSATKKNTIIDMTQVEFISSIGMRMLLSNAKALQQRKKQMFLVNLQPLVADALKTAGIDQLIPFFDSVDEAVKSFDS